MIYALLRIRTIYLEIVEKNGLPFDQDQFNLQNLEEDQNEETKESPQQNIATKGNQEQQIYQKEDYSKNYYQLLLANPTNHPNILQKVLEIFRDDQWTNKPTKKYANNNLEQNCKGRFSEILKTQGDQFILWALRFDLSDSLQLKKKLVVWQDIRISRNFLRYIIKKFEHHFGQKALQVQSMVQYETQLLIWNLTNLQLGYLDQKFYENNQPRQIAFQTLLRSNIGVAIIQPRRIALYDEQNNVKAFAYYQYIELLYQYKVKNRDSKNRGFYWNPILNRFNREFIEKHKNNPNTFLCFQPHIVFQNLPPGQRQAAAFNANSIIIYENSQIGQPILKPIQFNDIPVDPQIQSKFVRLPSGEFFCDIEFEKFQEKDKFKSADNSIINNVADEQGGFQLLRIIKSIPNLKFKLTLEQELMISTPSNLLCLGRSGTGKTTTSALRLFATEAYYKYHDLYRKFKLDNPNARNAEFQVPNDFIKQSSTVKLLFVSASPVLVNEVKRFFIEFKSHFTLELERKRKNQVQEEEVKIEQTDSDFLNYVEMEIKELEQEEQLEQQQSLVTSMDMLNSEDFPLFLTVKRLLYMLDASTDFPFFSRDKDGNQIGIDSNVQWHNESGGVFMINQYLKSNNDIDQQLKQLGLKLVEYTAQLEDNTGLKEQQENELYEKPQQSKSNEYSIGLGDLIDTSNYQSQRGFTCQSQNLSSEVDFEIFKVKFWPKIAPKTNLTPIIVWTEICSEIKGRYDSWKYEFGGIPDSLYVKLNRAKNHFLSGQERFQVYEIFLMYEKWKSSQGSYDLNDLVNHILKQVKVSLLKQSQTVHFLMVDEVQDLSQNVISLFMMLADKNVFFSGDTAQTIAKGVGFRFFDLKQVFTRENNESQINFQVPKVLQLVKNFRSHSKILDLANSVVSLLELLFPKTIDKLLKEKSDIDGPRPIVIDCEKNSVYKLLEKYLLFGSVSAKKDSNQQQTQFGCTQVIIVRDQESKERIPEFMKDLLCLTIYEAKGLEFDDVILFNFFQDSKCESQWKLLNDIIITKTREKLAQKLDFLEFDSLECEEKLPSQINEANDEITEIKTTNNLNDNNQEDGETQVTSVLTLKSHHDLVYRKFALVCTELKLLYVAITRPKNLLIIYDESNESRKPIQEYWRATNVIDFIDRKMLNNYDLIPSQIRQTLRISDTPDIVRNPKLLGHQSENLKQTWMLQGLKLFKVRFYRAAAQCFQNIGQTDLQKRCQAYESADNAAQIRGQHDQKLAQSTDKSNNISKQERSQLKKEAKDLFVKFKEQMIVAGKLFSEINLNQHAAQCFYSAGNLQESSELFIKQGKSGHAAECLYKLGQFKKAASLYCEAKLFQNAFECYERLEDWDGLIISLHKYKEFFGVKEREMLLQKYFPIALNSVYQFYGQLQQDEGDQFLSEDNKGKIQQMKLKLKFQKSVSIIEELNAEQVESSESEPEEVQNDQNQIQKVVQSNLQQYQSNEKEELVQIDTNQVYDNSFSIIDDQEQQQMSNQDQGYNYQDISALEIELFSNIDPNDEFLQSEKAFSIIESVSLNDSSFSVLKSQTENSEYSIISGSSVHSAIKSMASFKEAFGKSANQTIDLDEIGNSQSGYQGSSSFDFSRYSVIGSNQKQDCFAEDMVVQKVIYYISLFRKEVMEHLNKTSDRQNPLIKAINEQANDEIQDEFMYIDLDEISDQILKIVVEILEHYEMYRLCLIIYNRFKMSDRMGMFVQAIGLKYSNLSQFRILCTETFKKPTEKEAQRKYALLAHEAIQNVLNLISSSSQRSDWIDQSFNCLFLQGYWKKTVFLLECQKSIELCWVMSDINSLKLQFLVQKAGISNHEQLHKGLNNHKEFNKLVQSQSQDSQFALVKCAIYEEESQILISKFKQLISKSGHSCRQINDLLQHNIKQQSFCIQCWSLQNKPQNWVDLQSRLPFTKYLQNESISILKSATFVFGVLAHYKQFQNKYWQTHYLDLMFHGIKLMSKAFHGDQLLKKTIFKTYGVSLLDGFELFGIFQNNYCVVKSDSCIFQDIVNRQELGLIEIRIKLLKEFLEEEIIRYPNEYYVKQLQTVRLRLKEEMQQPDLKYQFEIKHAIVCDINLGYYLVPKSWVKEIIIRHFVQQIIDFLSQNQEIISSLHSNEEVQAEILATTFTFVSRMLRKSHKSEYSTQLTALKNLFKQTDLQKRKEDTFNQAYKYCFNCEIDQIFDKCSRSCLMRSNQDLINELYQLKVKAFSKLTKYSDQQNIKIMIKPEYSFFQSNKINYAKHLEIAINYFNESKTSVRNEKIADSCYKICNSFIRIDAEIILLELLQKNNCSTQLQKTRKSNISLLLTAHHYAKCNNLNESSIHLIKFLSETYTTLSFVYFKEIITEAFSKAWFSFQIYNSTEGKVKMQARDAQTVSNQLKPISNTSNFVHELQDIRIQVGNMQIVNKTLIWVECFLMNLIQYEGYSDFAYMLDYGVTVVQTVLNADLTQDQLLYFWPKIKLICEAVMRKGDELRDVKTAQIIQSIANLTLKPQQKTVTNQMLQFVNQLRQLDKSVYICYQLRDRKLVMDRINQIQIDVENCHIQAIEKSNSLQKIRLEAANKIYQFWAKKKQSLQTGQLLNSQQVQIVLNYADFLVPQKQIRGKNLRFLLLNNSVTGTFLQKSAEIQYKITQFTCSRLVNSSSNFNKFIELLQKVIEIENYYLKLLQVDKDLQLQAIHMNKLKSTIQEFDEAVIQLKKQNEEQMQSNTDIQERKRFQKREKWENVIQFYKKKRQMLRHFKSTMKKLI